MSLDIHPKLEDLGPLELTLPCQKCGGNVYCTEVSPFYPFCRCKNCNQGYELVLPNLRLRDDLPEQIPALSPDDSRIIKWRNQYQQLRYSSWALMSPEKKLAEIKKISQSESSETRKSEHSRTKQRSGCYIATAIYGSYDCPQVWTLRRFRDNILSKTWYGQAFIRTYYIFSPILVKRFGESVWFRLFWKSKLDRMVECLNKTGISDLPYCDRELLCMNETGQCTIRKQIWVKKNTILPSSKS